MDLLAVQRSLMSLLQHHNSKESILRHSSFFMVPLSPDYWKAIALTIWTYSKQIKNEYMWRALASRSTLLA